MAPPRRTSHSHSQFPSRSSHQEQAPSHQPHHHPMHQKPPPNSVASGGGMHSAEFWKELLKQTVGEENEESHHHPMGNEWILQREQQRMQQQQQFHDERRGEPMPPHDDDGDDYSQNSRTSSITQPQEMSLHNARDERQDASIIRRELEKRHSTRNAAGSSYQHQSMQPSQSSSPTDAEASPDQEPSTAYIMKKFRSEYAQLREKYRSSLDVAFTYSNLLHQTQLYTDQLKKSYAHREIEITTLKQNIEALNSALKRTQKVATADRQKQTQLMDKLLEDYDRVMDNLVEKRSLLDIIDQQKDHIVEQSNVIEALKRELDTLRRSSGGVE